MAMARRCLNVCVYDDDSPSLNRALLLPEEQWTSPSKLTLSQVRGLMADQALDLGCVEYSFLTASASIISKNQEDLLTVNEICRAICDEEGTLEHFTFSVLPVQQNNQGGKDTEEEVNSSSGENHRRNGAPLKFKCPFRDLKDVFNIHDHMNAKNLLRVMIALVFALACTMFLLVCTFQMVATTFGVLDLGKQKAVAAASEDGITELRLKLQEVELQSSYKVQELEKRLQELEDMYLQDVKLHGQEMARLKASLSGKSETVQSASSPPQSGQDPEVRMEKTSRPDVDMASPEL